MPLAGNLRVDRTGGHVVTVTLQHVGTGPPGPRQDEQQAPPDSCPHDPPQFPRVTHPLNSTPSATDEFRLPDHHSRSAAVRSFAGGDGQLTPRLLGAAAHVNLPDADRAGAAMRQTVGMRVAGVSTADTHSDWGWRRRLVASRPAKPTPQHVTETLPFRHHAAPSSSLVVRRLSYAMHPLPQLVVRAGVGKLRTWRSTLREVRVEIVGDARPTSPTTRSLPGFVGRIAGKFPMLDLAQLTAQTRKALEPFGAVRIRSFLPVLVDRRVVVALRPTLAAT